MLLSMRHGTLVPRPKPRSTCQCSRRLIVVRSGSNDDNTQSEEELQRLQEELRKQEEREEQERSRREQIELEIMRMKHAQVRKGLLMQKQSSSSKPGSSSATTSSTVGSSNSSSTASTNGSTAGSSSSSAAVAGPPGPRRKVLRKSKRMQAMAAGAGLLRVAPTSSSGGSGSGGEELGSEVPGAVPQRERSPLTDGLGGSIDGDDHPAASAVAPGSSSPQGGGLAAFPGMMGGRLSAPGPTVTLAPRGSGEGGAEASGDELCVVPKPIFIVSDCTGESAARTVRAALNQFELCFKTRAPATLIVFRFVEDEKKAYSVIETAAKEDALVVYTLVNPASLKAVQTAIKLHNVRSVDLWSNLLDEMERHLDAVRSGVPMTHSQRRPVLTEDYFRMIEAVEYTRKMDDGANPGQWRSADLLILGVSRCGKTPLSIFLGQRGYKVANLPLVQGAPLPKELWTMDQTRIVGLTIDPQVLASIRRHRLGMMGSRDMVGGIDYAELAKINSELQYAKTLYAQNPQWPVLDVTLRGVEETAARILKILNDSRGDASPQWVEEMYGKHVRGEGIMPPAVPLRPLRASGFSSEGEVYAGGDQYLVEGLY